MSLLSKEKQIIKFIKNIPVENTQNCFSCGKDSIVLWYFIKMANVNIPSIYGNTTIDPIGAKKLIKEHYSDVKILQPKTNFFKLVAETGLPTRVGRFCCQHLKEFHGIGKNNIEGIRREEGSKRAKYEPIQCDTRKWMKGAQHYYPIIDLTTREIWKIINDNNLTTLPYYHAPYNWKRHGCVGCPLASPKQQVEEYKVFPKYAKSLIKAIIKNMKLNNKIGQCFDDPYEVFWWWISRVSIPKWKSLKECEIWGGNYKSQFYKIILNEKLEL